jgi:AraC-like DNA-binding protein
VEFWSHASCNAYHPLQIHTEASDRFWARMWRSDLASIGVFRIAAAKNIMSRTSSAIVAGDPDRLHLQVQVKGRIQAAQQHRASVAAPGDIMSYETSHPVTLRSDHAFEVLVFSIPKAMLGDQSKKICHQTAVKIAGGSGLPRLAVPFFQGVAEGLNDGSILRGDTNVADRVVDLVLGLYADPAASVEPQRLRSQTELLLRAKAYIETHLGDRDLVPEDIARACFISIRYLHKLFEADGLSVCEWIRMSRLERSRRDLLDPAFSEFTILEIASRWGLPSAPHFSRLFHAAYGCSPREYRRGASAASGIYENSATSTHAERPLRSCGI